MEAPLFSLVRNLVFGSITRRGDDVARRCEPTVER